MIGETFILTWCRPLFYFWIPAPCFRRDMFGGNDIYGGGLFSPHFRRNPPCHVARGTMKDEDGGASVVDRIGLALMPPMEGWVFGPIRA